MKQIKSKERCEQILYGVPGILYELIHYSDGSSQFLYVSPQSMDILEIKGHVLMKNMNKFWDIIHPDDLNIFRAADRIADKEGKFNAEIRIITPSGKNKWIKIISAQISSFNGESTIWTGFILDITEDKKVENKNTKTQNRLKKEISEYYNAWKSSEEKYRDLVENSNTIIIKFDIKGNILFFNEFATKFFGYRREEIIGQNVIGTIVPETESTGRDLKVIIKALIKKPQIYYYNENENRTKSGERVWISWANKGIFDDNDNLIYIQSIGIDSTARKKAEDEKEQLIKDLKLSNEDLENYAHVTSHDLQEPLRAITSFSQIMAKRYKGQLDKDANDFLDYMVKASKRMKAMITALLNYSKLNREVKELNEIDINRVLESSLFNLKNLIEETNTVITSDDLPTLMIDKEMISLVLQNLVSNSIKFRKVDKPPKIHISASLDAKKEEYIFKVSDNGIGMEQRYTNQIFQVFRSLHPIGEYEGIGIGLSICKKIISGYGGHIWVKSELGKGSTFYFTIPLRK